MLRFIVLLAVTFVAVPFGAVAQAQHLLSFYQGFENNTSGWTSGGSYGSINRVASGTNGIQSYSGNYHAIVNGGGPYGPYTNFGGYSSTWPGPYQASLAIYLDTAWAPGSGFDYAVASSRTDGSHLRDFVFHVTKDTSTGNLLVAGSNNTNFAPREDLDTLGNHHVVESSGWYTFEHQFYDIGGHLAVDLVLYDEYGTELFRETRQNAADSFPGVVGGNRYGWFTHITGIVDGLAIDSVPEPATISAWLLVGAVVGCFGWRNRSRLRGPRG